MSFTTSVRTCLSKYADFNGRATRSEFWWFYLFTFLVNIVFYIPFLVLISVASSTESPNPVLVILTAVLGIAWLAVVIALFVPYIAVGCRRLHDRGQSGWLQLLLLVPCGGIALLILWLLEGTRGDNQYGPPSVSV